jgi:hypothetical protein
MAIIGMDIHRSFAQAAFLQDGQIKREQWVELVHDRLVKFGAALSVWTASFWLLLRSQIPSVET